MARGRTAQRLAQLLPLLFVAASGLAAGKLDSGAVLGGGHAAQSGSAGSYLGEWATLSDNMGGAYKFTMRLLHDDVEAWSLGSTAVLKRVPQELKNATLFAGTRDLVWNGILTVNAKHAGYAYIFASPLADGGITKLFHEQVGSMRWEGTDSGELVIYRVPMKTNSWIDIPIDTKWNGGIAFQHDESAEEKATNMQMDYMYYGCQESRQLIDAVEKDDPLSMTVERCFIFCSSHAGKVFFGVERGRKCWCAPSFHGVQLEQSHCNTPCDGNRGQMCGGDFGAASVHVIFNCQQRPPTEPEILYDVKHEQSCGGSFGGGQTLQFLQAKARPPTEDEYGGHRVSVDGSETLVGETEDCQKACNSSHECGAFTYDTFMKKCTFLVAGDEDYAIRVDHLACYFKVFPERD